MPSKPFPKPASARTIQRKYNELAVATRGRIDITTEAGQQLASLLHQYCAAFSNLYGVLSLQSAWNVLCETEPELICQKKLLKKDLFAFSDLLRAEDLPYYVLNPDEIWPDDPDDKPADRILVNKKLIGRGYYRFHDFDVLVESQNDKPFLLLSKKEYLAWAEPDAFRKLPCAQNMLHFLETLRVSNDSKNQDVDGRPICGKALKQFIFWSKDETFSYNYPSRKWEKDAIAAENNLIESEKLMQKIERNIQLGDPMISISDFLHMLTDDLEEVGVRLTEHKFDKLIQLYTDLNNKSNLWCNGGWPPEKLSAVEQPKGPPSISFGPGLQAAIANGDIDPDELERFFREKGIRITDE